MLIKIRVLIFSHREYTCIRFLDAIYSFHDFIIQILSWQPKFDILIAPKYEYMYQFACLNLSVIVYILPVMCSHFRQYFVTQVLILQKYSL